MHLGTSTEKEGIPTISFTSEDTDFLTERLGHAVVGKFSHSIPSSFHIQKALGNIKFAGNFSWKYLNAKHILIQLESLADYGRLLNGPNGTPVWFIDRHPMRVFKWTPEFDPFFECPIAAVWCNLIGLPVHLFEQSALFAIGKLLGEPIHADRATISQERLSFARMCVEIDISKKPTEEIILEIAGKEVRQRVKWDRIPLYCDECRHVGHSNESCYANGNRPKPEKKNYNNPRVSNGPARMSGQVGKGPKNHDNRVSSVAGKQPQPTLIYNAFDVLEHITVPGDEMTDVCGNRDRQNDGKSNKDKGREENLDEDGFQLVTRQKGRKNRTGSISPHRRLQQPKERERNRSLSPRAGTETSTRGGGEDVGWPSSHGRRPSSFKPSYYRQLEHGGFDTETFEEVMDAEIIAEDLDPGNILIETTGGRPERDKHLPEQGALEEIDDNQPKKLRSSASGSSH